MKLQRAAPGVLANDNYLAPNAQARLVTPATYGTVAIEADGAFVYEPNWRFSGYDYFTYEIATGDDVSAPIAVRISPPNVIVILVDDLGQGDIGVYDSAVSADTPNLNALANAGMVFSHAHSPAAVCSPSRYSILTGNYPNRARLATGIWDSYEPTTMIIPGQSTLGDIFSEFGYQTAFIGKLHNGGAFWSSTLQTTPTRAMSRRSISHAVLTGAQHNSGLIIPLFCRAGTVGRLMPILRTINWSGSIHVVANTNISRAKKMPPDILYNSVVVGMKSSMADLWVLRVWQSTILIHAR